MSITIISTAGNPNSTEQTTFMIDSENDVASLPTNVAPMSTAVTNTGDLYVLGNDCVWRKW